MACTRCSSDRIIGISGKTSDMCFVGYKGREYDGYVPHNLNVGGGGYLEFKLCLECGQLQGTFPVPEETIDLS